jgi:dTDP-4-amino-4,6-dideoxygalactose transaminase
MYRGLPSAAHSNLPVAKKMAAQILCLPIYPGLSHDQVDRVLELLRVGTYLSSKLAGKLRTL